MTPSAFQRENRFTSASVTTHSTNDQACAALLTIRFTNTMVAAPFDASEAHVRRNRERRNYRQRKSIDLGASDQATAAWVSCSEATPPT